MDAKTAHMSKVLFAMLKGKIWKICVLNEMCVCLWSKLVMGWKICENLLSWLIKSFSCFHKEIEMPQNSCKRMKLTKRGDKYSGRKQKMTGI